MTRGGFDRQRDEGLRNKAESLFNGSRKDKAEAERFVGIQGTVALELLDAWWRRAGAGAELIYCEAVEPIRDATWRRAGELASSGFVRTHARRRAGGGKQFFIVRTSKKLETGADPVEAALADEATDAIFRALKRAANLSLPCPSDAELARSTGLGQRQAAGWRVRKLIDLGLVGSTMVYDGGVPARVVTIVETKWAGKSGGRFTALPRKWKALRAAAERELKRAGGQK